MKADDEVENEADNLMDDVMSKTMNNTRNEEPRSPLEDGRIRAVIFDMDGLLLDTERLIIDKCHQAAVELGYEVPEHVFVRCIGTDKAQTSRIVAEEMGPDFPVDDLRVRWKKYVADYIADLGVPVKAGVWEWLDELTGCGIPAAVATSTKRYMAEEFLAKAGLLERFVSVTCGDDVTHAKPDPEIFMKASGKLGIPPEECLVFEDSGPGLRASAAAGMRPVLIVDIKEPDEESVTKAFAKYHSLIEALSDMDRLLGRG